MVVVRQTEEFLRWLRRLKDGEAVGRIRRMDLGNPGDAKTVGKGVMEMGIAYGPGYRVYYTHRGVEVEILLCGGDKRTQRQDIKPAQALAQRH
jgi:putative addiction module killer protein